MWKAWWLVSSTRPSTTTTSPKPGTSKHHCKKSSNTKRYQTWARVTLKRSQSTLKISKTSSRQSKQAPKGSKDRSQRLPSRLKKISQAKRKSISRRSKLFWANCKGNLLKTNLECLTRAAVSKTKQQKSGLTWRSRNRSQPWSNRFSIST